ncbi:MAG: hypothetical protein MOB07_09390 [Acidobacteria bacterium]|nr:hypothetical protein [Acidobacteriota bacterium]
MAWTLLKDSLKNSLSSKPPVLAGPILRKVTDTSVTVWLALKESSEVTLEVFISDVQVVPALFFGKRKTVRIGKNLHLVAVTARPRSSERLQPDKVYYYDLSFPTATGPKNLRNGTATDNGIVLGYGSHRLPSFSIPPAELNNVRIIQGSCRKPNATGADALATLDNLIEVSAESAIGRPHQLLLTGDQIYADEVADVLLLMLTDAASALLDLEPLPLSNGAEILPESLLPALRTTYVKQAGFTTVDTRSHLMSLGEYLAMYLFVWSDVLWPRDLPTYFDVLAHISTRTDVETLSGVVKLKADIENQRNNVMLMRASIARVRRALANVPTHMIFDDHEVTDDWNMTGEFCEKVYGNVLGMRIVQNALLAYALCQHWGNAPEQFEPAHSGAGSRLLNMLDAASGYRAIADNPDLQRILGLHTPDKLREKTPFAVYHEVGTRTKQADGWVDTASLLYHYTIEAPAHQIIITDTRTWRSFRGTIGPPNMIAESQIAVQIGQTPPLNNRLLLVVVSTNMPSGPGIRQGARDLKLFDYADFYDSWEIERIDFARAVAQLSQKFPLNSKGIREGAVVLLSGDVHSSSASRIHYRAKSQVDDPPNAPNPANLVFAQLIGSALRNEDSKTLGQHKQGYEYVPPKLLAKILKQDILLEEGFVGWNPRTVNANDILGYFFIHDKFVYDHEFDFKISPDNPTYTLREQELPKVWEKHITRIVVQPQYWIRLDYLKAAIGGRYKVEPTVSPPSDPLKGWEQRSRSYQRYARAVRSGREIVGMNNIGEIEFRRVDNFVDPKLTVLYTVRWQEATPTDWVRFDVSLDANDRRYKEIPRYKDIPHTGEPL